jgi:hypothetical protein
MRPNSDSTPSAPRRRLAGALLIALAAAVATPTPRALAEDEAREYAFRLYFALPFIATGEMQPARLGFQLMQETSDGTTFSPLHTSPEMRAALDLGFTMDGLAKFDVNGVDARSAYEVFARAIGLTPDEIELCRETDCLDWVKPVEMTETLAASAEGE